MQEGDFVYIDYIGRIKDTGEIFDLTQEEVAKKEGIFNQNFKYGPVPIIVGANFLIKGLENAIKEMKVGDTKEIEIGYLDAFGERNENLMQTVLASAFQDQKIEVGMIVAFKNNLRGRITSISGGRVKVDFNHPLASKNLVYQMKILSEIKEKDEKIKSILKYYLGFEDGIKVKIEQKTAEVEFEKKVDVPNSVKQTVANTTIKWIGDIEKVKFIETFENK